MSDAPSTAGLAGALAKMTDRERKLVMLTAAVAGTTYAIVHQPEPVPHIGEIHLP